MHDIVKEIKVKLKTYCAQLPVVGFNSSKYDMNLIKHNLTRQFYNMGEKTSFVVKKGNAYTCMTTSSFKFLDMSSYLAPGTSYSQFLKAYQCSEEKAFFPYEYFTDFTMLSETQLPL